MARISSKVPFFLTLLIAGSFLAFFETWAERGQFYHRLRVGAGPTSSIENDQGSLLGLDSIHSGGGSGLRLTA